MTRNRGRIIRAAAFAYAFVLAIATLLPSGTGPLQGWDAALSPNSQNLLHVPAYALLFVFVAACALPGRGPWTFLLVGLACAAFGAALEVAQATVPGRMGSFIKS